MYGSAEPGDPVTSKTTHGRQHLRVTLQADAWCAWGYNRQRCDLVEFSSRGLTLRGVAPPLRATVAVELPLPEGTFTVCGEVVHCAGSGGAVGVRLTGMPGSLQDELELYLWELLAAASAPQDGKVCSIAGCGKRHKARGFCSRHYNRWRRQQSR